MRAVTLFMLLLATTLIVVGCKDRRTGTTASGGKEDTPAARLHWAARNGDLKSVQSLIAAGCNVDARDADGRTALHLAVAGKHSAAMIALLEAGADPRRADRAGKTPMRQAAQCGSEDLATDFLLASGDLDI